EGGRAVVAMLFPKDMGGITMYNLFEFKKIVPMESIEFTNNLCDKQGMAADPAALGMPPDFPVNQRVLLTFQDLGQGRSRLTVTECKWTPGQMMKMAKMGMEQSLEKLAALPGLRG
ncbi:MAG TPA: SRPBCC domain-containing protein, partial [bacterium]|nr:SRPBCC domain-containing protein [bacterium]